MAERDPNARICGYRRNPDSGEVESQIFDADKLPKGWADTPAKATKPAKPKKAE